MGERSSGILLHITSLPGSEGTGTLGADAYRFVDFLAGSKQKYWQILPLGPVGSGNSPYQCFSAFAGNILLIDLDELKKQGLLSENDLGSKPRFKARKVEFQKVDQWKIPLLRKAFYKFRDENFSAFQNDYNLFLKEHDWWLQDFALFMAAKNHFGNQSWLEWPEELKFRQPVVLHKFQDELKEEVGYWKFLQFMFFRQWFRLKEYANRKGVQFIGDVPLYVSTDSSDVWTNTDIFLLDENLNPTFVGGVPPDYFSETGQLWGNPVYHWRRLKERGYDWWMARLHFNLNMFNLIRIDHFRGLESFWSVPASEKTAIKGEWVHAHGHAMLATLKKQIGKLPLIAEDLGIITDEVKKLRNDFGLPGMKVLQFAFAGDVSSEHLPFNFEPNGVVFTGTHDNDTTLGWLQSVKGSEKQMVRKYLGRREKTALKNAIEMVWASVAKMAVMPMQDLLGLDSKSRMNTPGTPAGNWGWRFEWKQLKTKQKELLKCITEKYNR